MHDEENAQVVREYRERIAAGAGDRQALADIDLELQLEDRIDGEQEGELREAIDDRLVLVGGWGDTLPTGLEVCPYCREVREDRPRGERSRVLCRCAGIACRSCGAGKVRRPVSGHYDLADHCLWHTPHLGQRAVCHWCSERGGTGTPRPRVSLTVVHEAALALRTPGPALEDLREPGDLVALHGGARVWHDLWLGPPPDDRPLYVGRNLDDLDLRHTPRGLRVTSWRAERPRSNVAATLRELLVRWQPPLNTEIETPWSAV